LAAAAADQFQVLPSGDQNSSTPALPSGLRLPPRRVSTWPEILVIVFLFSGGAGAWFDAQGYAADRARQQR